MSHNWVVVVYQWDLMEHVYGIFMDDYGMIMGLNGRFVEYTLR
jgi:hypothetical protein